MRLANAFFACLLALTSLAQKPFEGRIVYNIDYRDAPQDMQGLEKMLPSELVMIVNGTTSRKEQQSVFGGKQVFLNWADQDSTIVLVDILDQKLKYTIPQDKREMQRYRVTETDESKEIKGYTCKKALLQTSKGVVLEAWYTAEFLNPDGSALPQLKGLPLKYELSQKGMTVVFTARTVKEEPIDETYFVVPEEYEATSLDRFNEMIRQ